MEAQKKVGKIHRKIRDMDLNEVNSRTSYNKYHNEKTLSKSSHSQQGMNDNISEKSNSVQTSYQYRKKKNGQNSISSKYSEDHLNNQQNNEELSVSISDNDNLICANCINSVLIEEKQKRDFQDKDNENTNGFFQGDNNNYERKYIDERRRQREYNTNEAIQNLAKINAGLSNKDKLIQLNENSRNPLNDGLPDYQYQRFKDEYERKQKMINDNINKYYPKSGNEKSEIDSYYDNYVYNPKYNSENEGYNNKNINKYEDNVPKGINKQEYLKSLEDQINYKNELKRREKEEDKKREQEQYENLQKKIKEEEMEKHLKEQKQKEELIRANKELINQKNKLKIKELEDNLKYKEYYDRENEEYKKQLMNQKLENERKKKDMYNDNFNEYDNRKNVKEQDKYNNNNNNEDVGYKNINKEKMGRCCRCHRIFPRRLLTINRYFYKENRK